MKPFGHQTITQEAVGSFSFPFYLRHWLPQELPGTAVQADRYLYNDSYAHFMRSSASETGRVALDASIHWVRQLVLFSTQQLYALRRDFKIGPASKSSWSMNGHSGPESRNTSMEVPHAGFAPWAIAGPQSLGASSGDQSIARIQSLLETISDRDPFFGKDTYKISFSIGFAIHAMQDSYTARHAERCDSYAGAIARLYEWDSVRDATLIGVFPEHPTVGARCNNYAAMSHYESDLLQNWTGRQRSAAFHATRDLIHTIIQAADTATDFTDLKTQFNTGWDDYCQHYLRANLELDSKTKLYVTQATDAALNPDNYSVAGRKMTY